MWFKYMAMQTVLNVNYTNYIIYTGLNVLQFVMYIFYITLKLLLGKFPCNLFQLLLSPLTMESYDLPNALMFNSDLFPGKCVSCELLLMSTNCAELVSPGNSYNCVVILMYGCCAVCYSV
jgi:hypothetical protein